MYIGTYYQYSNFKDPEHIERLVLEVKSPFLVGFISFNICRQFFDGIPIKKIKK